MKTDFEQMDDRALVGRLLCNDHGYAYMSIKSFRKNIGVSLIALKTEDGRVIPGEPVRARDYEPGR